MTAIVDNPTPANTPERRLNSLALEITGQCQNTCASHCYAKSGPHGSHGSMRRENWFVLLDQAAGLGVTMVQYIGGEPTLHPHLPQLIDHALTLGMRVEVFSNLVHVRPSMWRALDRPGVSLATSYYSNNAAEHEKITGGRGSYARTRENIGEAVRRGIPLRAGIIHVVDGQNIDGACAELRALGVTGPVGMDRARAIGNGGQSGLNGESNDLAELCGRCGTDRVAISPNGIVTPCVMSRWLTAGDVRRQSLADILTGVDWAEKMDVIPRPARVNGGCTPDEDSCMPSPGADFCVPKDSPCQPAKPACLPKFP